MANPYQFLGEPMIAYLVAHKGRTKDPIYCWSSYGGFAELTSAPMIGDIFPPTKKEPSEEQEIAATVLLYKAIDCGQIPSNPRAKNVFGFDSCESRVQEMCLLQAYRRVKSRGIHHELLDSWRTKATMEAHIGEILRASMAKHPPMPAYNQLQALEILRGLDREMEGRATNWTTYERLLRSKMGDYDACIKCGARDTASTPNIKPLNRCGRCKKVFYCSKACQKQDWNVHKGACKQV
ncbi:hypothetical protein LTS15_009440 [Exophiala xenobiotica]|nr:hypothetical protein LTS15_009440 [Exophiala xenobiotica]